MKYAITGPKGRIFRVVDEEPTHATHYAPITEEQATLIEESQERLFLNDGELLTPQQHMDQQRAERQAERLAEMFTADPDSAKQAKRQELANARYEAEIGGIEVNGMAVRTDRETQSILGNARQYAKEDPSMTVEWKLGNGQFVTLDSPKIIALAGAVLQHVQAQFVKERELNVQVDAATTLEELTAIGW